MNFLTRGLESIGTRAGIAPACKLSSNDNRSCKAPKEEKQMSEFDDKNFPYPMRIQAAPGSEAEYRHYRTVRRRSGEKFAREALAPGVSASPKDDLIFRGGKTLPQMGFQNIYLGRDSDFASGDVERIDDAITRVMRDEG